MLTLTWDGDTEGTGWIMYQLMIIWWWSVLDDKTTNKSEVVTFEDKKKMVQYMEKILIKRKWQRSESHHLWNIWALMVISTKVKDDKTVCLEYIRMAIPALHKEYNKTKCGALSFTKK